MLLFYFHRFLSLYYLPQLFVSSGNFFDKSEIFRQNFFIKGDYLHPFLPLWQSTYNITNNVKFATNLGICSNIRIYADIKANNNQYSSNYNSIQQSGLIFHRYSGSLFLTLLNNDTPQMFPQLSSETHTLKLLYDKNELLKTSILE